MKVLVACEYSGTVRDAFWLRGHDAISCDILPTESAGPHYQGDVRDILYDDWDLIVAHPPCTYLSKAGARWLWGGGELNKERYLKGLEARDFFMLFYDHPCPRVAVENPTPLKVFDLPPYSQEIQPYQFGHPYSKRTLLWLKGLPELKPTSILDEYKPYLPSNTGGKRRGQKATKGAVTNKHEASRFWQGIAEAMAEQWHNLLKESNEEIH